MRQVMTQPGEIQFKDVSQPNDLSNEVLLKIQRIGVCRRIFVFFMGNIRQHLIQLVSMSTQLP